MQVGITCEEVGGVGAYVAHSPGFPNARMHFHREDGLLVIDDTDIPEQMPVECVDRALVERVVMDARAEDWLVRAECPLAKDMLHRHPQWSDVLA